jgi:hypothetical protein
MVSWLERYIDLRTGVCRPAVRRRDRRRLSGVVSAAPVNALSGVVRD